MDGLLKQVEHSIRARELLREGQRVVVAVSGGVDSQVLLHLLHQLSRQMGWQLTVAHFNHQLRGPESDADQRLVRRTARQLNWPCEVGQAKVRGFARDKGISLEMAARDLRHRFLADTAARLRIRSIALAHHADDRVELFFLRLFRGSGADGLAGMEWRSPSPARRQVELVRPLLDISKPELREFAKKQRIEFREDATNASLEIQRNRIRHELLPLLREHYQPALDKTILRSVNILAEEAKFVRQASDIWLQKLGVRERDEALPGGMVDFLAARFDQLPVALQRRCLQRQLRRIGVGPDFDLVEQLRLTPSRLVCASRAEDPGVEGQVGCCQGGQEARTSRVLVFRDRRGLIQVRDESGPEFRAESQLVSLKAAGQTQFGLLTVRWQVTQENPWLGPNTEYFDAGQVGGRVKLRHWRPGDRFQPIGMAKAVKLQDLFINAKIPRQRRHDLVVGQTGKGEIFWVEGLRISERFKLTDRTIRRLQWCWERL